MPRPEDLPIIYSCSGCSSAAEAADLCARKMDRLELADMGCIAGVGGTVPPLVAKARSGRPLLVVDGCPLACARACLAGLGLQATRHLILSEAGIGKRFHSSPRGAELQLAEKAVRAQLSIIQKASKDENRPPSALKME